MDLRVYPFSGSTTTSSGDKARWQTNDFGYYAVRYAPQVNPILMTGGYYNITNAQQWDITTPSLSGSVTKNHNSQDEFYNGEFSGSTIIASQQNINPGCDPFKNVNNTGIFYSIRWYNIYDIL